MALIALVIVAHEQIGQAFVTFSRLNIMWLLLVIPLQLLNYFSAAKFYQSYLKTLGEQVRLRELYKVALEMNFVNNVFPSGGVSGFGYLGFRLRKLGVKASKSTLLQTSRHFLTFISFIVYLVIAIVLLSIFGSASRFIIMIASSLSTFIVIGTVFVLYIISSKSRVKLFMAALPKFINQLYGIVNKKKQPVINIERIEKLFEDLHVDFVLVRGNWQALRAPFLWTMLMNLTEIATIFVVYLSFAELVNPGAIIISYAVANIAGLVSILPGGVGVYEGLMTGAMASAGINEALALSATVVYRILNMSIFLPIGYVLYQRILKQEDKVVDRTVAVERSAHD